MKDIPIIFSGPMVHALLDGRKTMTRRLAWISETDTKKMAWLADDEPRGRYTKQAKLAPITYGGAYWLAPSPWQKAKPGDRLWVREAWARISVAPIVASIDNPWFVYRDADNRVDYGGPWKPSIHLPRTGSRLTLVVTAVKVEPLQAISHDDAVAEGVGIFPHSMSAQKRFKELWNSLHGEDAWDANPEVVAITFVVHKQNIDALTKEAA